jgi:hypothetical protein
VTLVVTHHEQMMIIGGALACAFAFLRGPLTGDTGRIPWAEVRTGVSRLTGIVKFVDGLENVASNRPRNRTPQVVRACLALPAGFPDEL